MKKVILLLAFPFILSSCGGDVIEPQPEEAPEVVEIPFPEIESEELEPDSEPEIEVIDGDDLTEEEVAEADLEPDEEVDLDEEEVVEEDLATRGNWAVFVERYNENYTRSEGGLDFDTKQVTLSAVVENSVSHENVDGNINFRACFGMSEGDFPLCQIQANFSTEARDILETSEKNRSLLEFTCLIEGKTDEEIVLRECVVSEGNGESD